MNTENFKKKFAEFHDKNYKKLLLIPLILFILGSVYLGVFYSQNNDFFHKDISLTGGTSVTINDKDIVLSDLQNYISDKLESTNVREISDLITKEQIAVIVETKSDEQETRNVLENFLGYELDEKNSSFEFTGSSLSENFYNQLLIAILIAFAFMAIVVFIQFRLFIPSIAVITSAFANIFFTTITLNILGIPISTAGIVSILMIIGYSVDTDILLINKVLRKREGSVNSRLYNSFKTGILMTVTSLLAVTVALIIVGQFSSILSQIFLIMTIGLGFDVLNTWLTNVSIIKWYALKKEKNEN
ncbi:MAG: hypothetical protein M1416_00970 [Candidatus Pacearchaeota archaeon]|nr:hypothetical protein [Candidatus Pacearchaeota archaeon]